MLSQKPWVSLLPFFRNWDLLLAIVVAALGVVSFSLDSDTQFFLLLASATVFAWAPVNIVVEWLWMEKLARLSQYTRRLVRLAQLAFSFMTGVFLVWFVLPQPATKMGAVAFLLLLSGFPVMFLTFNFAVREFKRFQAMPKKEKREIIAALKGRGLLKRPDIRLKRVRARLPKKKQV